MQAQATKKIHCLKVAYQHIICMAKTASTKRVNKNKGESAGYKKLFE